MTLTTAAASRGQSIKLHQHLSTPSSNDVVINLTGVATRPRRGGEPSRRLAASRPPGGDVYTTPHQLALNVAPGFFVMRRTVPQSGAAVEGDGFRSVVGHAALLRRLPPRVDRRVTPPPTGQLPAVEAGGEVGAEPAKPRGVFGLAVMPLFFILTFARVTRESDTVAGGGGVVNGDDGNRGIGHGDNGVGPRTSGTRVGSSR